jgi:glycosyltransferase involved in cell wall biosynthesis
MNIVHLAASPFLGGPESQMLGLVEHLPPDDRSAVLSFSERGRCRALLDAASALGAEAVELRQNAPSYRASAREIAGHLRRLDADVLCCHGYKPDILGLLAARQARVPVVSVSHGWTAATWKVRLNEAVDRFCLHGMDRVVCVSERQAGRVRRAGVPGRRIAVIPNAIDATRYGSRDLSVREELLKRFPGDPPRLLIGAAGRLSPEKGYGVLVEAASIVTRARPDVAFLHFGDGPLRSEIAARIESLGLSDRFVLGGFRTDLARILPAFDLFAQSSHTEGLPVAVLEAFASRVPVVATAVGGTPEVIDDGGTGRLVPSGDPSSLARAILDLFSDEPILPVLGERGRAMVLERFTFPAQARRYRRLFASIAG